MKMVKNIAIVAFAASFMFGSVSFHLSNTYSALDNVTTVEQGWGATYALNESMGLGYDDTLGMLMYFEVPAGVSLRISKSVAKGNGVGLGYTWWSGGTGLKTSISTSYDQMLLAGDTTSFLSMTVGFGF